LLASAGENGWTLRIWDVFSGKQVAHFAGHRGPVFCVAFSPDGKTLASGSADTTILLWDVSGLQVKLPSTKSNPKVLTSLWTEMRAKEASKAYQALWGLVGAGDNAVTFLRQQLSPIPVPDTKSIQQLIADLDNDNFEKREAATAQLTKLREVVEPAMHQALQAKPTLEARKRLERLLAELAERPIPEGELRQLRTLHALELIGSPAARDLLKKLASGAPGAALTRDAKLALQRLERRANKP